LRAGQGDKKEKKDGGKKGKKDKKGGKDSGPGEHLPAARQRMHPDLTALTAAASSAAQCSTSTRPWRSSRRDQACCWRNH
jgi:hypothetical protein